VTATARVGAQGLQPRKCAPAQGKTRLSTKKAALYYYDYVFIKTLRRRQKNKSANQSGLQNRGVLHLRTGLRSAARRFSTRNRGRKWRSGKTAGGACPTKAGSSSPAGLRRRCKGRRYGGVAGAIQRPWGGCRHPRGLAKGLTRFPQVSPTGCRAAWQPRDATVHKVGISRVGSQRPPTPWSGSPLRRPARTASGACGAMPGQQIASTRLERVGG
jgi:hypothetical protein